jgi:hypothetical protein
MAVSSIMVAYLFNSAPKEASPGNLVTIGLHSRYWLAQLPGIFGDRLQMAAGIGLRNE